MVKSSKSGSKLLVTGTEKVVDCVLQSDTHSHTFYSILKNILLRIRAIRAVRVFRLVKVVSMVKVKVVSESEKCFRQLFSAEGKYRAVSDTV